ncbi:MAG TPA: DUF3570 domain-containing protein [Polyangia bacterium]|nr:DUF3570 domain-containing protein [Polyangia bacterium]
MKGIRIVPLALALAFPARADDGLSATEILTPRSGFRIESARLRFTHFDQDGHGYQSLADRPTPLDPGRETLDVEQIQAEVIARHGKFTHRLWVPVDVVTAASPDALDAVSSASRLNVASTADLSTTYQTSSTSELTVRGGAHLEEPFRSWLFGVGGARSFADGNTTVAASSNQALDWFDVFLLDGERVGRRFRSSTNANLSVTQLLSPTTVGLVGYGGTLQLGELTNGWNAVPLADGTVGIEQLPKLRHRHALVGRLAQALPWHGIAKGAYRFYLDNWGILGHTAEGQLYQRLGRHFYLRGSYRYDGQTAARYFNLSAPPGERVFRTADSDLDIFRAHTFGLQAAVEIDLPGDQILHFDLGYEHFTRNNDLHANVYSCSSAVRF